MIKKIKIIKPHKTIQKDFELELEQMTVITGENNSGKTNFIQAIYDKKDAKFTKAVFFDDDEKPLTPEIVYIAAENIRPSDDEAKSSAKTTGLIKKLSKLFTNLNIEFNLEKKQDIVQEIKNLEDKTNKNLESFTGSTEYKLEIDSEGKLDVGVILQALIKNIKGSESGQDRGLEHLGQGIQRIIVASILKAYIDILIGKKEYVGKNPILIILEEPEIYLHPKLKKALNATLGKIAKQDNHQVIITTHDPYFAYTNLKQEGSIIYSFFRDESSNTDKKEPDVIFGIEDELLHIYLFEKMLRKARDNGAIEIKDDMDETSKSNQYLKKYCNGEIRSNIFPSGKSHNLALPLHVRHVIHHPLDGRNVLADDDLEKSIKILNKILSE
ncbi:MAG: AAA family ATPase [Patescibacteria group bacterium]|nr:AAA family ATPase [Patescibacteria group bacterium]